MPMLLLECCALWILVPEPSIRKNFRPVYLLDQWDGGRIKEKSILAAAAAAGLLRVPSYGPRLQRIG